MATTAQGQPVPARSASVGIGLIDFSYAGNVPEGLRYDYEGPAIAVEYRLPSLVGMVAIGTGDPTIVDAMLAGWMGLLSLEAPRYGLRVPVVFNVGYRRANHSAAGRWDATRIGLGVGFQWMPPNTSLTVRANPTLNLITSTLATGYGLAPGAEVEAFIVVAQLRPGMFLELGYHFRYQDWNINPRRGVATEVKGHFDYTSVMHVARAGIRF